MDVTGMVSWFKHLWPSTTSSHSSVASPHSEITTHTHHRAALLEPKGVSGIIQMKGHSVAPETLFSQKECFLKNVQLSWKTSSVTCFASAVFLLWEVGLRALPSLIRLSWEFRQMQVTHTHIQDSFYIKIFISHRWVNSYKKISKASWQVQVSIDRMQANIFFFFFFFLLQSLFPVTKNYQPYSLSTPTF